MEVEKFFERLPIGINVAGKERAMTGWRTDFEPRELYVQDSRVIRDKTLKKRQVFTWLSRVLAVGMESIAGVPVYAEFKRSGEEVVPNIVLDLSIKDAQYLLLAIHIHNLGGKIENLRVACPYCEQQFATELDLAKLKVSYADGELSSMTVRLPHGFDYVPSKDSQFDFVGKTFNVLQLRIPTLRDFIIIEGLIQGSDDQAWNNALYARCLQRVLISDSADPVLNGSEMSERDRTMLGTDFFSHLRLMDSGAIATAFNNLPAVASRCDVTCTECRREVSVAVDSSFLLQTA
jgi:hypothetical protein